MYAIIKTGGKQYRVTKGDVIDVELLHVDEGAEVEFQEVLFFSEEQSSKIGNPIVSDCLVKGKVLGEAAGPKIDAIKYKPSHNQHRRFGHRQHYSQVQIDYIGQRNKNVHNKQGS